MELIDQLWSGSGLAQINSGQATMILISLILLYLAIAKKFEPLLLVTIGFGGLLSNIPGVEIATGDGLLHLIYVLDIFAHCMKNQLMLSRLVKQLFKFLKTLIHGEKDLLVLLKILLALITLFHGF